MASILANTLRASKKIKDSQGTDDMLSKVVELNGNYRLFFKTVYDEENDFVDVATAMVPGRSLDLDVCGATFIPYSPDMYTKDESGVPQDITGLRSWARIAKVLHDASCKREIKNITAEAERGALELGTDVDQVELSRKIEAVKLTYMGGKAADGTNIPAKKNPFISGMQQKVSTRILVVKLLPDGSPDLKNIKYAVLELSRAKIDELITLLDDKNYCNKDDGYLEVGYSYVGSDKNAAGRAAKFQGIADTLKLAKQFPTEWEQHIGKQVKAIADAPTLDGAAEIMRSKNRNLRGNKGPADIISSVKAWIAKNAVIFGSIDFEADATSWASKDFLEFHLVDNLPQIKEKFEKLVEEIEKKNPKEDEGGSSEAAAPTEEDVETTNIAESEKVAQAGAAQGVTNVGNISNLAVTGDLADL